MCRSDMQKKKKNAHEKVFTTKSGSKHPGVQNYLSNGDQSLSSTTSMLIQWAHEWSSHVARMKTIWNQHHGFHITKADLATTTADCSTCPQKKLMSKHFQIVSSFEETNQFLDDN